MSIPIRRGREVTAARGTALRCKGWRQEAILRLLENNLENAEDPDNLVIYMSIARAARDWQSFDRIVATLADMREDQTLVVQSGKPIGVFPGQATTPLVIMANGNIVGEWSDEENRRKLDDKGLTIMPGMTAGAWQYIGSQGILQGTYETFMAVARSHFGGTLAGRLLLTAGCGGMGGDQPLGGKPAGASTLVVEVDQARIDRRIASGYCDRSTDNLEEAIRLWQAARDQRRPLALALRANASAVLPAIAERGIVPDIVTDQTFPDPLKGYVPAELSLEEARDLRKSDPEKLIALHAARLPSTFAQCSVFSIAARSLLSMATASAPKRRRRGSRTLSRCVPSSTSISVRCSARASVRSAGSLCPVIRRTSIPSTT